MKLKTIINASPEERTKPINLVNQDIKLFEHEFTVNLPPTYHFELSDVSILRNVIFSFADLKFFKLLTHIYKTPNKYFFKRLRLFLTVPSKCEKGIWITDEISAEYFHWFTDALTRLIAIEVAHKDIIDLKKNYPIILPEIYKERQYVSSSLKKLGYTTYYYNPKKRLLISTLVSCTHTAPMGNYNTKLINSLHSKLAMENSQDKERKIYISRAKATRRKITNEQEIIDLLISYNYEVHNFEDYTFEEQLFFMSNTKSLVALHGAGLTNMIFMNKGSQVLELRNEGDSHNNCYFALASSLSHNYFYLANKGDKEDTYSVNLTVDPKRLKIVLDLMN